MNILNLFIILLNLLLLLFCLDIMQYLTSNSVSSSNSKYSHHNAIDNFVVCHIDSRHSGIDFKTISVKNITRKKIEKTNWYQEQPQGHKPLEQREYYYMIHRPDGKNSGPTFYLLLLHINFMLFQIFQKKSKYYSNYVSGSISMTRNVDVTIFSIDIQQISNYSNEKKLIFRIL